MISNMDAVTKWLKAKVLEQPRNDLTFCLDDI